MATTDIYDCHQQTSTKDVTALQDEGGAEKNIIACQGTAIRSLVRKRDGLSQNFISPVKKKVDTFEDVGETCC